MQHERRRGARRRQAAARPRYDLVLVDGLLDTTVHLRTGLTHETLGVIYEVGSSTIGRAISEILPLLDRSGGVERVARLGTATRPGAVRPAGTG
ncbi:transposase family protein [Streptomyces griseorubiginosus]|uniref:transposase family protein n=1 Tax=Streptomyces griseorubiginosus TaxID=67304 RepID=UPI0033F72BA5